MFCRFCGAEIPEGVTFCPKCGSRLVADQPPAGAAQAEATTQPAPIPQPNPVPEVPAQVEPEPSQQAPASAAPVPPAAKRKPPLAAIVAVALVVAALVGFGAFKLLGNADADAFDESGNPTLYAVSELSGDRLCTLLEDAGWEWNEERLVFVSPDGNAAFSAYGPENHDYTCDEIRGMQAFGGDEPVVYHLAVVSGSYPTAADELEALVTGPVEVDEVKWLNEEQTSCAVAFQGACISLFPSEESGTYLLVVLNRAALERGLLGEEEGSPDGSTLDEIWRNRFGHIPGGEPASYPEDAVDAYGNPTLRAFTDLTGDELCDMLAEEGWKWSHALGDYSYCLGDASVFLEDVYGHTYTRSEIRVLPAFAVGNPMQFGAWLGGDYASVEEALSSFIPDTAMVDDIGWLDGERTSCLVAFQTESGDEGLVYMGLESDPTQIGVIVWNPEAIAEGAFESWWGGDAGTSVDEIWRFLFGRAPGEEAATYPAEALDAHGNPTLYAVTELDGAQLSDMLAAAGWRWDTESLMFFVPNVHAALYAFGPDSYEYTYSDISGLSAFGSGSPVQFVILVEAEDYPTTEDALSALVPEPLVIEAIEWSDERDTCFFAFHGPSGERSFAMLTHEPDNGTYRLVAFNPEAISQGLFADWLGEDLGTSVDEVWNNMFGYTPGA